MRVVKERIRRSCNRLQADDAEWRPWRSRDAKRLFMLHLLSVAEHLVKEVWNQYHPQHLLIETSGSALPGTLVMQLRRIANDENLPITMDLTVCVVDILNHLKISNTSPTARLQAQFTDLILLNKCELAQESDPHQLDRVLDELNEVNPNIPKLRTGCDAYVDPSLIFGFEHRATTLTSAVDFNDKSLVHDHYHHQNELTVLSLKGEQLRAYTVIDLNRILALLPFDTVFRIKGFMKIHLNGLPASVLPKPRSPSADVFNEFHLCIINCSFGKYSLIPVEAVEANSPVELRFTIMGAYELRQSRWHKIVKRALDLSNAEVELISG